MYMSNIEIRNISRIGNVLTKQIKCIFSLTLLLFHLLHLLSILLKHVITTTTIISNSNVISR